VQIVETTQHRFDPGRGHGVGTERLDGRFHAVRHVPQPHRTGQSRAALEGVQHPQSLGPRGPVVRVGRPLPQRSAEFREQFCGLLLEYRKQVGVQRIHRIGMVIGGDDQRRRASAGR